MEQVRVGVDVGGTFTKAVAIQPQPYTLIAQALVPTTHSATEGVAAGIVQVLDMLLRHEAVMPRHVSLVAHSTTQAVNALLEGDVAPVGIVGMGGGTNIRSAARHSRVGEIALASGKFLRMHHTFVDTTAGLTSRVAADVIDRHIARGAASIVASEAFSVDDPTNELCILTAAAERGVPAVAGHQLSGVYGLEIRTLTAAINASLLPKMLQTAELVERALRVAGIDAPLMVMRGDGGLADLETLRRRPILTLLSGPAASLAGALLSGRVAEGILLEIGGTSSNLAVIHEGQPELRYVRVMDYPTCVRSLDVRVQGAAGGSLLRMRGRRIVDVGPRSAHIAGLPYASLSPEVTAVSDLEVALIAPQVGDPEDYVVVQAPGAALEGRRWAVTLTCAANALGLVPEETYAYAARTAAMRAFDCVGRTIGCSSEDAARRMLDLATERITRAVKSLAKEYKLRGQSLELIGAGGGAGAIVPAVAARLGVRYRVVQHAEVISSLGDALASVREEIERAIVDGISTETLVREVEASALRAGAEPSSIQVVSERDEDRGILRAIATGNVALVAPIRDLQISEPEARAIAANSARVPSQSLALLADTGGFWVYQTKRRFLRRPQMLIVDHHGVIRSSVIGALLIVGSTATMLTALRDKLNSLPALFGTLPRTRLLVGSRLLDLAVTARVDDMLMAAEVALVRAEPNATIVAVIER